MEQDTNTTEVIFRKFKDGDVIAFFPYEIADSKGNVMSYMHVGQHGAADYQGLVNDTKLATEDEYKDLFNELENSVGYKLKVVKKMNYNKWLQIYREGKQ